MFGFKKAKAVGETKVANEEVMQLVTSNADTVRQSAISILDYDNSELTHQYEVQRVIGADINDPIALFYDKLRTKLFDADFRWFVKADFINKFSYCASLNVGRPGCCTDRRIPYSTCIEYIGDIPDSVLDRLGEAREMLYYFTVHSNQPLKVGRLERVDPVLIGWRDDPAIVVDNQGKFNRCSKYGFVCTWLIFLKGVV